MKRSSVQAVAAVVLALVPGSMAVAAGFDPVTRAGEWLGSNAAELGLSPSDLAELEVTSSYVSVKSGVHHVWLQQHHQGVPITNALLGLHFDRNGQLISAGDRFERNVLGRVGPVAATLQPEQALDAAVDHLGLLLISRRDVVEVERLGGPTVQARFAGGALSDREIPVDLAWVALPDGGPIRLAWRVEVDRQRIEQRWPVTFIDAQTGDELVRFDQVAHGTTASYRVYEAPLESPGHPGAAHTVVSDPWDLVASPFGWHDTNGIAGVEFTDTRGNNVFAQDDLDANNSGGSRPSGGAGAPLSFDFAHDDTEDPITFGTNLQAAIVNLFYWNNVTHDILYRVGFDEPARNFQENNYGRGGVGGDPVDADALDGSGTNNANFGTPGDGSNPRMQMFRWTGPAAVDINPGATTYAAETASFGATLTFGGFTDDVAVSNPLRACSAVSGVSGMIALVERGDCEFGTKGFNVQAAGATGMIVFNNSPDPPIPMGPGAQGGSVNIPAVMVSQADGQAIQADVPGITATLRKAFNDRDSDFDAGIIAHEYGHGWSNRLTGGASVSCLGNQEQAGEGWSDFLGLVMTMGDASSCSSPRGIGTYASFQPPTGPGIRRFPYTPDMGTNPFTYGDTNDTAQSVPHGVGSVWATALWDLTCNLVGEQGFDDFADLGNGNGGNTVALQLVSDGLKLQPCSPGMIDARNAILAADLAAYGGAHTCLIWETFARRGFGFSASQGSSASRADQVEAFDMPASCPDAGDVIFRDGFEIGDSSRWSAEVP